MPERAAGLLLEREVSTLTELLEDPARPLVAVLGGAKVSDKIARDRALPASVADTILIGGAMCFPFLAAQGHAVGASLCADEDVELARADARVWVDGAGELRAARRPGDRRPLRAPTPTPESSTASTCPTGWMGLDIGPRTAAAYGEVIAGAGTVFWNGPMGAFELDAVRRRHARGRGGGRGSAGRRPSSAAATRPRRSSSSAWPTR